MRILFVSNMFPPHARGGYEQWCEEVAVSLAARGHVLSVLTSRLGASAHSAAESADSGRPFAVHRRLHTQVEGTLADTIVRLVRNPRRYEAQNLACVREVLDEFRPDAVLIWGMWNIDRAVPQLLEACLGSRVAYYLCDYWPSLPSAYIQRLQEPAQRAQMQLVKALLRRYFVPRLRQADDHPLRLEHPICVSRAVRDLLAARGAPVAHAKIIYGGTSVAEFDGAAAAAARNSGASAAALRLLYMGRLERMKGVHTVVRAMGSVPAGVTLDIVGRGLPEYEGELRALIAAGAPGDRIRLAGGVPRAQVPQLLAQYDALVFPSEWEEPFARTVLEAMAAGLPVIGTTTGGTGELLVEGETGLTFGAGNAQQLADQIRRLHENPGLRRQLAATAHRTVHQYYTIGRMVDELEAELAALARSPSSHRTKEASL